MAAKDGALSSQRAKPNSNPVQITAKYTAEFSGPLPHPRVLEGYDAVYPGAAKMIIDMAQSQAAHRMGLENRVIDGNITAERNGQVAAFVLAILVFSLGTFLVHDGHAIAGGAMMTGDLVTILSMFIYGNRSQARQLRENSNPFRPQKRDKESGDEEN